MKPREIEKKKSAESKKACFVIFFYFVPFFFLLSLYNFPTLCRYETGGTLLAALVSLERGISCSTAGGTHHAGPDYGSGSLLLSIRGQPIPAKIRTPSNMCVSLLPNDARFRRSVPSQLAAWS